MSNADLHHLAAAYALDALDADERLAFESHVAACQLCGDDIRSYRDTASRLAVLTTMSPPPDLRDAVLTEIGQTRQLSPIPKSTVRSTDRRRPPQLLTAGLAVAAAIAMFIAGAVVATQRGDGFDAELASVLSDPSSQLVQLESDGPGVIRLAWTDSQVAVIGDGLVELADGLVYELWLIDESGATPIRMLDPADDGELRRTLTIDRSPLAWGITAEPASGSDSPTEPILFIAET